MISNKEIKDHLKKLRQIKRDLKRDPHGTPLRKCDKDGQRRNSNRKQRRKNA